MTAQEIMLCEDFVRRAMEITQKDMNHELRQRYNTNRPKETIVQEHKSHIQSQLERWKVVKDIYCNNKELIDAYHRTIDDSDFGKEIIESICKVIENEVESILLQTDSIG